MNYEDLKIGDFFKPDPNNAVTYRKDKEGAYNTRTGRHEFVFGVIHPVEKMTNEEIENQQKDHKMWGQIRASHDEKLIEDIAD